MPAPRVSPASIGRARSSRSPPTQFGTLGFAATSVAAIAEKAGISKPLIYNYFGSKEGLYEACLDRGGAIVAEEIERIARGDAVGIERGMQTLGGMFTLLEPQPYLWRLFFDPTAPTTGPIADSVALYADRIGKLAEEGVAELMTLAGNDRCARHLGDDHGLARHRRLVDGLVARSSRARPRIR